MEVLFTKVIQTLEENESSLVSRILEYAKRYDFTRYTSTLEKAWVLSIQGLTGSIVHQLKTSASTFELSPDDDYTQDPVCQFAIVSAHKHRHRGVSLSMYLGLFKYYRASYIDLLTEHISSPEQSRILSIINRLFDKMEIAFSTSWAGINPEKQIRDLASTNLVMTNEKNKFLTVFENIPNPVLILDTDNQIVITNLSFQKVFINTTIIPGNEYYGQHKANVGHLPWLDNLVFNANSINYSGRFELTIPTTAGNRLFGINVHSISDVSMKYSGRIFIFEDTTELKKSELRLRDRTNHLDLALSAANAGSWSRDMHTGEIQWDAGMERIFNLTAGTFSGTTREWEERVHPEDMDVVTKALQHALMAHGEMNLEYRISNGSGGWKHVNTFGKAIYNEEGVPIKLVGICMDITQRREAERLMSELAHRHHALITSNLDGYWAVDLQGNILEVNDAYLRLSGYSREELLSMRIQDLEVKESAEEVQNRIAKIMEKSWDVFSTRHRCKDGSFIDVEVSAGFTCFEQHPYIIAFLKDVSWRVRQERQEHLRSERFRSLHQLSTHQTNDLSQIAGFVLDSIVELTESRMGLLGFMNLDESVLTIHAWSRHAMEKCAILEKLLDYPIAKAGLWGEAVRQRAPVIFNDYLHTEGRKELPQGHVEIVRLASVPIMDNGKIVALAAVANKQCPYEDHDIQHISIMGTEMVRHLREKQANETAQLFRHILEESLNEIYIFDVDTLKFVHMNNSALKNLGYSQEEITSLTPLDLKPEITPEQFATLLAPLKQGKKEKVQFFIHHRRKDGTLYPVEVHLQRITFGKPLFVAIALDVTQRIQMEEHIRQAQKLQAVGTLAGGIAHDFNNLLAMIMGNAQLVTMEASETVESMGHILAACKRGKDLVLQLLTIGRRTPMEMKVVDPVEVVDETIKLMRSTLPKSIRVDAIVSRNNRKVFLDPSQLYQVLVNLCTNAGQAMGENGGILGIEMDSIELAMEQASVLGIRGGDYIRLRVRDTGPGIRSEHISRIFEPFFTTKEQGKGTGLGLAVVHSITRSCGGGVEVENLPDGGAEFRIYLPVYSEPAEKCASQPAPVQLEQGSGRILFVDDEPMLVKVGIAQLRTLGYVPVGQTDPEAALATFMENPKGFTAVITDQVMPQMTGNVLAAKILAVRPDIPIFLCTGYSEIITKENYARSGFHGFLMKPVALEDLSIALQTIQP
ncbi:MAG: PAS domain S-box protein [Magnetococcales bacterium]|nr:PAS domain S-box protein [Magnetococcales bacterium]NGZ25955.1 PAS domain S-box protein [Magnetococcales bacterium]